MPPKLGSRYSCGPLSLAALPLAGAALRSGRGCSDDFFAEETVIAKSMTDLQSSVQDQQGHVGTGGLARPNAAGFDFRNDLRQGVIDDRNALCRDFFKALPTARDEALA